MTLEFEQPSIDPKTYKSILEDFITTHPSANRGQVYESWFERVLNEMQKTGEIQGFRKTTKDSPEDSNGIDYWVKQSGKDYPFQIEGYRRRGGKQSGRRGSAKTRHLASKGIARVYLREKGTVNLARMEHVQERIITGLAQRNSS